MASGAVVYGPLVLSMTGGSVDFDDENEVVEGKRKYEK
jgi:hypothetical protein